VAAELDFSLRLSDMRDPSSATVHTFLTSMPVVPSKTCSAISCAHAGEDTVIVYLDDGSVSYPSVSLCCFVQVVGAYLELQGLGQSAQCHQAASETQSH
jgi:hypothetical protein